jgi:hypothetical protein
MVRSVFRDESKPLQWPPQMRPVLDDRQSVGAILECAAQDAVRQRIVRRKHAHTFGVSTCGPLGRVTTGPIVSSVILASFMTFCLFAGRRSVNAFHALASLSSSSRLRARPQR